MVIAVVAVVAISSILVALALYPVLLSDTSNQEPSIHANWVMEVVDSTEHREDSVGHWLSMDLDGNGQPHIGYCAGSDNELYLKYATRTNGNWSIEVAGTEADQGAWNWIKVDSDGRPNIVYDSKGGLKLAEKATNWSTEVIDPIMSPRFPTMAFKKDSTLIVSYFDQHNQSIRVAESAEAGWIIDDIGSVGHRPSMALGLDDEVHILYLAFSDATHATRTGEGWTFETIGSSPNTPGLVNSGAIRVWKDASVHVAYEDNGVLKYAVREDSQWLVETVDDELSTMYRSISLALQSNGLPAVSYVKRGEVTIAWKSDGGWNTETIGAASGDVSLALNSSGTPHLAYHYNHRSGPGELEESLRYAFRKISLSEGRRSVDSSSRMDPSPQPMVDETWVSRPVDNMEFERI
jgi:hypothetical protein